MMRHLRSPVLAGYLATLIGLSPMGALANPQGGQVVGGTASISGQGTPQVTVNQGSQRAIINWNTFNIGAGEKTRFVQPGIDAVALNRVTGNQGPSTILGTIEANGRVFLVNRDGILFGSTAVVNTGGFLATTHDIANEDFMAGKNNFTIPGNPSASIVNLGTITANSSGIAALVAPGVRNSGTITAELGKVALASNNGFTLDFYGDKLITMQVDGVVASQVKDVATGQTLDALVKNEGPNAKLSANGGRVELTAAAARHVVDAVINNKGVIEANSVGTRNGKIVLGAATASTKGSVADVQKVKVSGTLSASGKKAGEKGGKIQVTGENIALAGAKLDASGRAGGGTVLVGGDVGGGQGNAAVASLAQAALEGAAVATASTVTVDGGTMIDVSAKDFGQGGKAVVWSDVQTGFAGTILGTGGAQGGDGGFAEVSSKGQLAYTGLADLRASAGAFGTLLLDPHNLTISKGADSGMNGFVANADDSVLNVTTLTNQLAYSSVVVTTGGEAGNQAGDITVADSIIWNAKSTLTLGAYNNIYIGQGAIVSNTAGGSLVLAAGVTYSGTLPWTTTGHGTIVFQGEGPQIVWGNTGSVNFAYHPVASVESHKYQNETDFSSHVSVGSPDQFNAYMWVNNAADLQDMSRNLGGKYVLTDIDAGSIANFVPIGTQIDPFTGRLVGLDTLTLGGTGGTISNLKIKSSSQYVGLFGYLGSTAVVRDIGLINAQVVSLYGGAGRYAHVGALAGYNFGSISDSYAIGSVSSGTGSGGEFGPNLGGLVGTNNGSISRTYFNGTVTETGTRSQAWVGGLVGQNFGSISESYAEGAVNGAQATGGAGFYGGLVGNNSGGTIFRSYAVGTIAGNASAIVGGVAGSNTGTIEETYAAGTASGASVGGVVGAGSGTVRSSHAFLNGNGGFDQADFAGWDFSSSSSAWFMIDGFTRPFLRAEWSQTIRNAHQLQLMAMDLGANYTLANDIDLGAALANTSGMWGTQGFASIGSDGDGWFNGTFDGRDHTISGLRIATTWGAADIGLFGVVGHSGVVRDVHLTNVDIAATGVSQNAGAVAGSNFGRIEGVSAHGKLGNVVGRVTEGRVQGSYGGLVGRNWSTGLIIGSWADVAATARGPSRGFIDAGGLVGTNSGGISSSYAKGAVTGTSTSSDHIYVGGLVGLNDYGVIEGSHATGAVTSDGYNGRAGGLVAVNDGGEVLGSYASGLVSMSGDFAQAGGLVGENKQGAKIRDSHATGRVSAMTAGAFAGGLVGYNDSSSTIARSGATGDVTIGDGGNAGGLAGTNEGSISDSWAEGNVTGGAYGFVGGLVGHNNGAVDDSRAQRGTVTAGYYSRVGGLVGYNSGDIGGSFAFGNVFAGAGSKAGGLVGQSWDGLIDLSFAFGNVVAGNGSYAGGLVGYLRGASVLGAAASGDVTAGGGSYVGGLAGWVDGDSSLAVVKATGNVSSTGAGSAVGGLVGRNDGLISAADYVAAAGKGVYGTSNSWIGGLVGINHGVVDDFFVDPPVVGSGSGNAVGGAAGDNSGSIQNGTVIADVSSGDNSSVGPIAGSNSGTVSGTTFTGTVNGANPNTPPDDPPPDNPPPPPADNPPPNEPAPITQTQFTPPSDPATNNNFVLNQTSDPASGGTGTAGSQNSGSGSQGGQGGGQGGQGGSNGGGAGNNPPPPQAGPPPGPGIGRTISEQRFSGVPPVTETRFLPGEVVVQVSNTVPAERIQEVARQLGITLIASQAIDGSGRVVYRFSTGGGKNIRDIIRALERQQIVASAQPNYVFGLAQDLVQTPAPTAAAPAGAAPGSAAGAAAEVETGSLPPSPELSSDLQSDMASRTTGLPKGDAAQYIIDKLRLGVVHARALGRNIPVAVIDSEIDVQHPDLVGVVSETFDATGTASNPHAHGTGMAGAIASHRRLLGIAPGVKILAVKAFDETNTSAEATSFQILKGIDWAVSKNVRIINMSFAGPRDLMMERALQKAYDRGIVLIAAAGNAGPKSPPLYPAADVNVIAVSASDYADKPFAMANRGKHIAVAAPGVDVLVPSPKGSYQLTTGTSVAAAHVSGVAALLLESKPTLTPKEVRAILTGTAKPVALKGAAEIFGAGLVDPFEALSRLAPRPVGAAPAASSVN
jgi:filamentous hemagglutinin family protein